jgi:hypothetical protein
MLLGRAGAAAADTGVSSVTMSPAASNAIMRRRRMDPLFSGDVRIVRSLTPQILDWKESVSETGHRHLASGYLGPLPSLLRRRESPD